jgi:hypothetical protein
VKPRISVRSASALARIREEGAEIIALRWYAAEKHRGRRQPGERRRTHLARAIIAARDAFRQPGEAVERLGKVTRQRRQSRTTTLELQFGRPIGRIPSGSLMLSCSADWAPCSADLFPCSTA